MVTSRPLAALLLLCLFVVRTAAATGTAPCEPGHHEAPGSHQEHTPGGGHHDGSAPATEGCDHHGPATPSGTPGDCALALGCTPSAVASASAEPLRLDGQADELPVGIGLQAVPRATPPGSPPPRR